MTKRNTFGVRLCSSLCVVILMALMISRPPRAAIAQQSADKPAAPAANPADVGSLDVILAALYDVISGPAGKKRDWDRMRSLFIPSGRLIATSKRPTGEIVHRAMDVEGYITASGPQLETNGFFEKEIARHTDQFGNIVQVFSTYEGRRAVDDAKPLVRGINSIQLLNDGKRWWIVTVFWQAETPDNPLPEKYLQKN